MNPGFATAATAPLPRRDLVLASVGAVLGVGIGVAATRWIIHRRAAQVPQCPVPTTAEELRQYELLQRLAEAWGNEDLRPTGARCFDDILREVQMTLGLEITAAWNAETEQAILDMIQEQGNPRRSRPTYNPAHELEPEENWCDVYEREFPAAVQRCCEDDGVVAFDQAVVAVLEFSFPDAGSFALAPHTGRWKREARERACSDLSHTLGSSEVQARAVLCREVGRRALAQGADLGQAVRSMAQHAWPTAVWDGAAKRPWQEAFSQAAAANLQS
jgi:hypothetical protein